MLCCNDTLMGQNVPQLESEYILLMITLFQRLHNGSAKYLHPPYVSEQFTTDERRTVCNAGFLTESPKSSMFHSRRVKLPLATLALHIFSGVGCKDVRNVALQRVENLSGRRNPGAGSKPEFKPFPPWQGKSIDILNYLNQTLVGIINTD